jgi:hypothetical protein
MTITLGWNIIIIIVIIICERGLQDAHFTTTSHFSLFPCRKPAIQVLYHTIIMYE